MRIGTAAALTTAVMSLAPAQGAEAQSSGSWQRPSEWPSEQTPQVDCEQDMIDGIVLIATEADRPAADKLADHLDTIDPKDVYLVHGTHQEGDYSDFPDFTEIQGSDGRSKVDFILGLGGAAVLDESVIRRVGERLHDSDDPCDPQPDLRRLWGSTRVETDQAASDYIDGTNPGDPIQFYED